MQAMLGSCLAHKLQKKILSYEEVTQISRQEVELIGSNRKQMVPTEQCVAPTGDQDDALIELHAHSSDVADPLQTGIRREG